MLDDLFQAQNMRSAADLVARPAPLPKSEPTFRISAFATAAPRGVVAGAAQSGGFFADVLGAFGQAAATTYSGDLLGGMPDQQRKETDQARQQMLTQGADFSSEAGDLFRDVAKGYATDPSTAHVAERLVFDFARFATKAVGYTVAGGPLIGPALTGADEGMQAASDLKGQGVDLATRTKAGAVIGAVSAVGIGLPMAGRTALGTAGLVSAGGPVSFMAQQAAVRQILQDADYAKLAEQYDPFDPVGLAVSTLVPAAFGVHGLRVNKAAAAAKAAEDFRTGPVPSAEKPTAAAAREAVGRPSEEHVDAARTLLAVEERQRSNPFKPDDMRAYDVHEQALARAIDQMATGQPVHVAEIISAPDLTAARATLDQIDALQAERAGLLPDAGALAENGAIRTARQELKAMEQQRPDNSEAGVKALAKDIQEQQGVSYKAALTEARKQTDAAVTDFEARQTRINQTIDSNAKAQQATQKVGELDRRIAALEQQLGPEAKLAQFQRTLTTNMRALAEQAVPARATEGAQANAAPRPAAEAKPQAPDAASPAGAAPRAIAAPEGSGAATSSARLVDDGAAARVAQIEIDQPNLMVQLDGMDKPMRLADVLAAVKAEADEMKLDGDLMQAAAECALLQGV